MTDSPVGSCKKRGSFLVYTALLDLLIKRRVLLKKADTKGGWWSDRGRIWMLTIRYERISTHMAAAPCVLSGVVSKTGAALRLCT